MESVKTILPHPDACPPGLRRVVEAWKAGTVSNQELIEASFAESLNLLSEYRFRPLPDAPEKVRLYRGLTPEERREMSAGKCQQYFSDQQGFYASESRIRQENASNQRWLTELVVWAQEAGLPEALVGKIRVVLQSYTHEAEPVLV